MKRRKKNTFNIFPQKEKRVRKLATEFHTRFRVQGNPHFKQFTGTRLICHSPLAHLPSCTLFPPSPTNSIIIIINLYLYTKSYHFYMVFLGIVCKIILKYSKELLDYKVKNTKTYIIIRVTMSHSVLR